jgi:uroporphyrinogen-III synthase
LVADLVPDRQLAEGLVAVFPDPPAAGATVLFPRAAEGRDVLVDGLSGAGWEVDVVEAYRTVRKEATAAMKEAVSEADAVCFASSSSVTGFVATCGLAAAPRVVVCIGPVTAATALESGFLVDAVALVPTVDGLISALVGVLGR